MWYLIVTNKHFFVQSNNKICGQTIKKVTFAKYISIIIDKLTWKEHINSEYSKANIIKALLQRNLPQCPKCVNSNYYKTLLRPLLEYAATVWSPFTQHKLVGWKECTKEGHSFCYEWLLHGQIQYCLCCDYIVTLEQCKIFQLNYDA